MEIPSTKILNSDITFTSNALDIDQCQIYIIAVPTGIDQSDYPDLDNLKAASTLVGEHLAIGDLVIYESTVYPGCTEEVCIPLLEKASDLTYNTHFDVAYSPERINPGNAIDSLKESTKVIGAATSPTSKRAADIYNQILNLSLIHI